MTTSEQPKSHPGPNSKAEEEGKGKGIDGKRAQGRSRRNWTDDIKDSTKKTVPRLVWQVNQPESPRA